MKTNLIVDDQPEFNKLLKNLNTGDWFIYKRISGNNIIAIKGDDTAYDGTKNYYMMISPECGIISRLHKDEPVHLIENVKVSIEDSRGN